MKKFNIVLFLTLFLCLAAHAGNMNNPPSITPSNTATFTHKTFDTGATGNVLKIDGRIIYDFSGLDGIVALANSPALITPDIGVSTGTSLALTGALNATSVTMGSNTAPLCASTAPTVSGFGASPSVPSNNGTCAFTVNVGTGGIASTGTVNLATSTTGWVCNAQNVTSPDSFITSQTGGTVGTATFTNYSRTTGLAIAWAASDVLRISCFGY